MVRYHFVGIEGAHRGSVGGGGEHYGLGTYPGLHHWDRGPGIAFARRIPGCRNRILKAQLQGRLRLSDAERMTLGEIGHRLGRKALSEVVDTILKWYRRLVVQIRWIVRSSSLG